MTGQLKNPYFHPGFRYFLTLFLFARPLELEIREYQCENEIECTFISTIAVFVRYSPQYVTPITQICDDFVL